MEGWGWGRVTVFRDTQNTSTLTCQLEQALIPIFNEPIPY